MFGGVMAKGTQIARKARWTLHSKRSPDEALRNTGVRATGIQIPLGSIQTTC